MLKDLASLIIIGAAGFYGWHEAHKRGFVKAPPPNLRAVVQRAMPRPKASGDVDRIGSKTGRAVAYARQGGVPAADVPLVAAHIIVESAANPLAHNTNGEDSRGLMQVQLSTAKGIHRAGMVQHLAYDQLGQLLFDPVAGVEVGYAYIRYLRERIPMGWKARAQEWVIRGYNGGEFWHSNGSRAASMTEAYFGKIMGAMDAAQSFIQQEAL